MATDARATKRLTVAELCQAIEDRDVPFTVRDGHYELSVRELRRLQRDRAGRAKSHRAPLDALIAGEASPSEMGRLA